MDVSDSYREAIVRTVVHFTGRMITAEQVEEYENRGGWNDDWMLTHRLGTALGAAVGYEAVVDRFVRIFAGKRRETV